MLHTVVCVRAYHFTWQGFVGPMPHLTSDIYRNNLEMTMSERCLWALFSIEIVNLQLIPLFNADFDMVVVPHEIPTLTSIRKDEY